MSLAGSDRAGYVRDVFGRIAPRYDLMNRLMTAGQDIHWRQEAIRWLRLQPGDRVLDLGAGRAIWHGKHYVSSRLATLSR